MTGRILLIDDDPEQLGALEAEVKALAGGTEVHAWLPKPGEDALAQFESLVADATALVVTDYDLTRGPAGFFGASIVSWCQQRAIPVGDYSRGNKRNIPKQPSLFEFRFSTTPKTAAGEIVEIHNGFVELRQRFDDSSNLLSEPSPANMLAKILGKEETTAQLALYTPQMTATPGLVELFIEHTETEERKSLAAYLLGHLLFNSVLRYPGPVLDERSLCSYLAIADDQICSVAGLFEGAVYDGPFRALGKRYWRDEVDDAIDAIADAAEVEFDGNIAGYRRAVMETQVGTLTRYDCPRCSGERGGFRCPFTQATVCELGECSVGASAWLPQGGDLVRVERSYYDETAPMLGR